MVTVPSRAGRTTGFEELEQEKTINPVIATRVVNRKGEFDLWLRLPNNFPNFFIKTPLYQVNLNPLVNTNTVLPKIG
jgi:hypothetical protein